MQFSGAATALRSLSGMVSGAPQKAMMLSPMNLSSVPSNRIWCLSPREKTVESRDEFRRGFGFHEFVKV